MSQKMVERVAKAIRVYETGFEMGWGMTRNIGIAIAAIKAMREPTAQMNIVGTEEYSNHYKAWQAMIDAALAE